MLVQNGDSCKEVITLGQAYFAIQTYRQEAVGRFNELDDDRRRLVVRGAIEKTGGAMPEDLQTQEKSIQLVEKEQLARLKAKEKAGKLVLGE